MAASSFQPSCRQVAEPSSKQAVAKHCCEWYLNFNLPPFLTLWHHVYPQEKYRYLLQAVGLSPLGEFPTLRCVNLNYSLNILFCFLFVQKFWCTAELFHKVHSFGTLLHYSVYPFSFQALLIVCEMLFYALFRIHRSGLFLLKCALLICRPFRLPERSLRCWRNAWKTGLKRGKVCQEVYHK